MPSLQAIPKRETWLRNIFGARSERAKQRIGVELGATIVAAMLDEQGREIGRISAPAANDYDACLALIVELVGFLEKDRGLAASVGVSVPGSVSPRTGVMRNANAQWLNGRNFRGDLSAALARPVDLANDSDCLALSEAIDGSARDATVAFAIYLGAGVGAGLVVNKRLVVGANGLGGEFGHTSMAWQKPSDGEPRRCWCGRHGCVETWLSEGALEADYERLAETRASAAMIIKRALENDIAAEEAMDLYVDRLARALSTVCNIVDPDVIVVGGPMSSAQRIYADVPDILRSYIFSDSWSSTITHALWGSASGIRGAARLKAG